MADPTIDVALGVAIGIALTVLCLRGDTRPARTVYHVPALTGWLDPAGPWRDAPDRPWSDWLPDPAWTAELAAWDTEVDGLPWGYAVDQRPADVHTVIDEDGATIRALVGAT